MTDTQRNKRPARRPDCVCLLYTSVSDEETLGRIYVDELEMLDMPDQVKPYFDYEAYGRDACIHENGHFAPGGYVVKESDHFVEVYHGLQDIPKEHKVFSFPKLSIQMCIRDRLLFILSVQSGISAVRQLS